MTLTVLGSGTCELRAQRSSPAYLLEAGPAKLMLDLGQGAWRRLLDLGHDPAALDAVLISHHHPDHIADLLPLLFALRYDPRLSRQAHIKLVGHRELGAVLAGLEGAFGRWLQPTAPVLEATLLTPGQTVAIGPLLARTAPAAHIDSSLAFRLEHAGQSLVYLGDSAADPALVTLSAGADLLIAHCAGSDQHPRQGHLFPEACGRLAAEAGVGALLLSHFYADVDPEVAVASAAQRFAGPIWAAHDLMRLVVDQRGVGLG